MSITTIPTPGERTFLPAEYKLTVWSRLKPYFSELLTRPLRTLSDWKQWLADYRELAQFIDADIQARKKQMNSHRKDEMMKAYYLYALESIVPKVLEMNALLDQRLESSPHKRKLHRTVNG